MAAYRLYQIDGSGRFSAADWIEAADDAAAVDVARKRRTSSECEIWQGSRLVARIGEDDDGSNRRR